MVSASIKKEKKKSHPKKKVIQSDDDDDSFSFSYSYNYTYTYTYTYTYFYRYDTYLERGLEFEKKNVSNLMITIIKEILISSITYHSLQLMLLDFKKK
jgi:hypothetical protein